MKGVKAVATYLNAPGKSFNSALRFAGHDLPRDERILTGQYASWVIGLQL
ncbi:MAG: hypothetical protein ACOX1Y_08265 [Zhaonellaceae bacterium]